MNKAELIKGVAEITGQTLKEAGTAVEAVLSEIKNGVLNSGEVKIVGFGTFKTSTRSARTGRNPQTGAQIQIPEKNVVKFKSSF